MKTWKLMTEIKAPVELVWNTITDFSNTSRWNHSISKSLVLTSGLIETGSRILVNTMGIKKLLTIHDIIPYELLTARVDIGSTPGMIHYKLIPDGDRTFVEHTFSMVPYGMVKLLSLFLRAGMKMEFDSLKRWTEQEYKMLRSPGTLI